MQDGSSTRSSVSRRVVLGGALATSALLALPGRAQPVFRPEDFGARGDGVTNDSNAFRALAAAVNRHGGGTIRLARKVYIVGQQATTARRHFEPLGLLDLVGCRSPLTIEGNGAVLRAQAGLRYGTFEASGRVVRRPLPNLNFQEAASPYNAMIRVESCGDVTIRDVELDGNIDAMVIGGPFGDTGWQIPMGGLALFDNTGNERVDTVHSHDHGQDGMIINGVDEPVRGRVRDIVNVVAERNGRQGCSVIGGHGYRFTHCRFTRTGRGRVASAPGAGVDIEAEGGRTVSALIFDDCAFEDNAGCGMVADSGPSRDVMFRKCRFIGTTNWAAWPNKPGFRFEQCTFIGSLVHAFGSDDPRLATQFVDCLFTDVADATTGASRSPPGSPGPVADLGGSYEGGRNVGFTRCRFVLSKNGVLPWTTGSVYTDVTMRQAAPVQAYPRGTYRGVNRIDAPVDLYGSRVVGTLTLNGHAVTL
jgi:hypothetical protein